MKIDRITLFVMGQPGGDAVGASNVPYDPSDLWREISDCIGLLCEPGSKEAVCRTVYDGAAFDPYLTGAIGQVRTNPNAMAAGVLATHICVVYMINSAMDAVSWARCISQTDEAIRPMGFQKVDHIALVQRDGLKLDHPELAEALDQAGASVCLFSQNTQKGWMLIAGYEELKMLSYYAALAAGGLLPEEKGVYTGSYNKLSLTQEDFRRIRTHYAVCGLTGRLLAPGTRQFTDDQLFSDFIGGWIGGGIGPQSELESIGAALIAKVKPLFPDIRYASIMANENYTAMDDNIDQFIKLNFEGEWFRELLARFDEQNRSATGWNTPEAVKQKWTAHFDSVMETHPEYYSREVADYLRRTLLPWLQIRAKKLDGASIQPVECGRDKPIAYAIARTERCLKPYYNRAASALLMSICRTLAEQVDVIYACVRSRDQMISRNKWLLTEGELRYDRQYARTIMDQIETNLKTSMRAQERLVPTREFFGDGQDVSGNWARLVNELQQDLETKTTRSLIDVLRETPSAEFKNAVRNNIPDNGVRLTYASSAILLEGRGVVYVCSNRLIIDAVHQLPTLETEGARCSVVMAGFDNLLQFNVYCLKVRDRTSVGFGELFQLVGNTERFDEKINATDEDLTAEMPTVETVEPSRAEKEGKFEVQGASLRVRLPKAFVQEAGAKAKLRWVLTGYTADNVKAKPMTETQYVSGIEIYIPLGIYYGRCRIELSCDALGYHEVYEFTGQKVSRPLLYGRRQPLFNRRSTVLVDGVRMKFDRWICALDDDRVRSIKALVTLNPGGGTPLYYPVGDAGEWQIWLPEDAPSVFYLETGDDARVFSMQEKD